MIEDWDEDLKKEIIEGQKQITESNIELADRWIKELTAEGVLYSLCKKAELLDAQNSLERILQKAAEDENMQPSDYLDVINAIIAKYK